MQFVLPDLKAESKTERVNRRLLQIRGNGGGGLKRRLNCFHIFDDDKTIGLKFYLVKQTSKGAQNRAHDGKR